jgi:hypothetical protein
MCSPHSAAILLLWLTMVALLLSWLQRLRLLSGRGCSPFTGNTSCCVEDMGDTCISSPSSLDIDSS